jgi:hypothetical protein
MLVRVSELGDFLKSKRAALAPESVGLPPVGNPRRVAGLRREEVAQLAAMSVDHYTRLEQGRVTTASDSVLNGIAAALRLTDAERTYLGILAQPPARSRAAGGGVAVRWCGTCSTPCGTSRPWSSTRAGTSWPGTRWPWRCTWTSPSCRRASAT